MHMQCVVHAMEKTCKMVSHLSCLVLGSNQGFPSAKHVLLCTGDIMFCDGSCMRAFHCGVEKVALNDCTSGSDQDDESAPDHTRTKLQAFHCNPLDMPLDLYWHLKDTKDTFHCPNCLAGVHQCFKCKQEGVVETHAADSLNARFAKELVFRCNTHLTCFLLVSFNCSWLVSIVPASVQLSAPQRHTLSA